MNGFAARPDNDAYKIVSLMVQSLFPPIRVQSVGLIILLILIIDELIPMQESGYV